jgi:hypothetical protein
LGVNAPEHFNRKLRQTKAKKKKTIERTDHPILCEPSREYPSQTRRAGKKKGGPDASIV